MRAATQIHPASLAVEADGLVRGDAGDDLGLVVLAQPFEERHGLIARHLATLDPQISLGEFAHLRLDGGEVLGRERTLVGEVVIEAVFDDRTDGDLRLREECLRRLREQMCGRVADHLERVRVFVGDDLEHRVRHDRERGIYEMAAHLTGERGFRKPRPDVGSDLRHGDGTLETALAAIRQRDHRHGGRTPGEMVGASGIEPPTTTMSRWCSTTELRA